MIRFQIPLDFDSCAGIYQAHHPRGSPRVRAKQQSDQRTTKSSYRARVRTQQRGREREREREPPLCAFSFGHSAYFGIDLRFVFCTLRVSRQCEIPVADSFSWIFDVSWKKSKASFRVYLTCIKDQSVVRKFHTTCFSRESRRRSRAAYPAPRPRAPRLCGLRDPSALLLPKKQNRL